MFIMIINYVKPLEEVNRYLAAHRAFLDEYYKKKKFICSGRQHPTVGGLVVADLDSMDEAKAISQEDPYTINKVAEYKIIEFEASKYDERFACFLKG